MSSTFVEAIQSGDADALRFFAKADRHCHSIFGARLETVEAWAGRAIPRAPASMDGLGGMSRYISTVLNPITDHREGVEFTAGAAIEAAVNDGVTLLEMSVGSRFAHYFPGGMAAFASFVGKLAATSPSVIEVRPELGIIRQDVLDESELRNILAAIESGVFRGIDLYGAEGGCTVEDVRPLFRKAREAGLSTKAHVGEFGTDAEAVRTTVELLELDAVQHGIAASASPEVMRWLAERGTMLNVCPTSNVALGAAAAIAVHPIRTLFENGVNVTVNTDDLTIFGQSVSEEFLNLYQEGVLSAQSLDKIRLAALSI